MSSKPHSYRAKWMDAQGVEAAAQHLREAGKRIVFTNGVFDLLHPGHVAYLESAKALGDHLIVGLNSDDSAKRLSKGPGRPINDLEARAMVLSGLACVDGVVSFEEDTPEELIRRVRPDVLCKGGDYRVEDIAGADFVTGYGGEVEVIPFLEGFSTTRIERRILNANSNHEH